MEKIRINDLARELEVKAKLILDLLPALGVSEKKTHSSSVDDDVAAEVRRHFENGGARVVAEAPRAAPAPAPTVEAPPVVAHVVRPPEPIRPPVGLAAPIKPPLRPAVAAAALAVAAPAVETPAPEPRALPASRPVAQPVRPIPPAALPGQPATGPRAPMPPSPPTPGGPARPPVPALRPPLATGQPASPAIRTLPGQPRPRPIVPPRPDLASRLARSPAPTARKALTPGQPIFQRPVRAIPGQPRPGAPMARGFGAPGTRPGPRPMHPTSRLGRMGAGAAVPPPPTQQRRPRRPMQARPIRDREREREEKILRRGMAPHLQGPEVVPDITREITISEGVTIKELSEKLAVKASVMIKRLFDKGVFATINQTLDAQTIGELARAYGASTATVSYEQEAMQEVELGEETKDLLPRAPVVTIMGHVDHGKTSLLDAIRETNVAAREAGGITQAIGAYQVVHKSRKIVFIDTPGHEAFTRMRARGAKVTDLVVLVVAADDGVMPQTLEAIDHARAAKVPILVAINKIDKPDAQVERVKQQLADRGLQSEDWGGDTVTVPVSARAKTNLDLLLEMVLLVADMQDLKSNPARPAMGTVLEAKLDRGQGPVATVLVQNGTLRVGDFFIVGSVFGKVRAMLDDLGRPTQEAAPATPVVVLGLEDLPDPGDSFQVVTDTAKARQITSYRELKAREQAMAKSARLTLESLHERMRSGDVKELAIILKADVTGSLEVLGETLPKLSNDKVKIRMLHRGVGAISESDALLAAASNAIVVGFNVRPERSAAVIADREKVDIRLHTVIYDVTDELRRAMIGLLDPVYKETALGRAEVRQTFRISRVGMVAGCFVQDGRLTRDAQVRLLRDNVVVYTGKVSSLRRFKDEASEVRNGFECGVSLSNFADVKPGDVIEAFVSERVAAEVLV